MSENLHEKAKKLAARPYTVSILRDDSDSEQPLYLALNPELEGCMAQGETIYEAEKYLAEFRVEYIHHLLENGLTVPYPASMASSTGKPHKNVPPPFTMEAKPSETFEDVLEQVIQPEDREIVLEASLKTSA